MHEPRKRAFLEGKSREGSRPRSRPGMGKSQQSVSENVGAGCACMDSRVNLSARTGCEAGMQGVGWYLAEREWKPGAGGPVL